MSDEKVFHEEMKCSVHGPVLKEQVLGRMLGDDCPMQLMGTCNGVMVKINPEESREWTQEEIREKFLLHISALVDYWADVGGNPKSLRDRLEGLAFSFLTMLDGSCMDLPSFEVIATPHESDKAHAKEVGDNWWPQPPPELEEAITIHGSAMLHEMWHDFRTKHGKKD